MQEWLADCLARRRIPHPNYFGAGGDHSGTIRADTCADNTFPGGKWLAYGLASCRIPQPGGPVLACRDDFGAVLAEFCGIHTAPVMQWLADGLTRRRVPNLGNGTGDGHDPLSVRAETHAAYLPLVAQRLSDRLTCRRVPHLRGTVIMGR